MKEENIGQILLLIINPKKGFEVTYNKRIGMALWVWASQMAPMVKNPPVNAGYARDSGWIPGLGPSPGEENGYPLVFLPGKFHGQRSLAGQSPRGCKESDMTERLAHTFSSNVS